MPKCRILIVDSDPSVLSATSDFLAKNDVEVNTAVNPSDPRLYQNNQSPHIVLVDSIDAVYRVRQVSKVPVMIASRKFEVADRIAAFEAGADDYLSKPYELRELLVRIRTILRRVGPQEVPAESGAREHEVREWRFKGLFVQSNRRRVILDGQAVELTTAEFDLLRLLVANAENVLSRERILEELRGIEWEAFDRSIDILVSRLRDKLGDDPRKPRFIRTIRSVGYQFVGEATDPNQAASAPAAGMATRL